MSDEAEKRQILDINSNIETKCKDYYEIEDILEFINTLDLDPQHFDETKLTDTALGILKPLLFTDIGKRNSLSDLDDECSNKFDPNTRTLHNIEANCSINSNLNELELLNAHDVNIILNDDFDLDNCDLEDIGKVSTSVECDAAINNCECAIEKFNEDKTNLKDDAAESSDNDSDYHSSDFEFITEEEATRKVLVNSDITHNIIAQNSPVHNDITGDIKDDLPRIQIRERIANDPFPSRNYENKVHIIPQGNDFLNLFQGGFAIATQNFSVIENKSFGPSAMTLDDQFHGQRWIQDADEHVDERWKVEAQETYNKIINEYSNENCTKKRKQRRI